MRRTSFGRGVSRLAFSQFVNETDGIRISSHDLRHTYATCAFRREVPVNVVSKALGHSSVAMTFSIYRHVSADEVRASLVLTFQQPPVLQTPVERTPN
ncbi:tyrosine-type recombinase/integrase [Deinococcus saxicola]|uniref:tyrosine-type recombinase/integrase n=1 Tax=Deinococcus saxicola TaxID=249406 RepID=UPI0039F08407